MSGAISSPAAIPSPRAPTAAALREAALAHLAQHATTRAGLIRVLDRRIARWVKAVGDNAAEAHADDAAALRQIARQIADDLVATGVVNDVAFVAARARSLARTGRSQRAISAHLAARGVAGDLLKTASPLTTELSDTELAAALATSRRRRIGPFRIKPTDAEGCRRELAMLARAGFSRATATAALAMPADQAEALVLQLKRL